MFGRISLPFAILVPHLLLTHQDHPLTMELLIYTLLRDEITSTKIELNFFD